MFQTLWQEGLSWNQKLPEHIAGTWLEFREELHCLERIRIPRWNGKGIQTKFFELHGFCDASEAAYSAGIYSRNVDRDGHIKITKLAAKTRVAPLKLITLPRLELCGLVLLANLMEVVKKSLDVEDKNTHAWTDSTIVLGWSRSMTSLTSINAIMSKGRTTPLIAPRGALNHLNWNTTTYGGMDQTFYEMRRRLGNKN